MKIMIVEDDKNLKEGLKLFHSNEIFSMILLDCNLPDGDGNYACIDVHPGDKMQIKYQKKQTEF